MKFLLVAILLSVVGVTSAKAEQFSMRKCMILPITDTLGKSVGFRVYENLERYLREKKWCEYSPCK